MRERIRNECSSIGEDVLIRRITSVNLVNLVEPGTDFGNNLTLNRTGSKACAGSDSTRNLRMSVFKQTLPDDPHFLGPFGTNDGEITILQPKIQFLPTVHIIVLRFEPRGSAL
ncbi:hypothetical protein J6590_074787 [Homalodisca vitripennis]|nr:hypothetical protein J6590_074787 [Homalodisca vitripennis]